MRGLRGAPLRVEGIPPRSAIGARRSDVSTSEDVVDCALGCRRRRVGKRKVPDVAGAPSRGRRSHGATRTERGAFWSQMAGSHCWLGSSRDWNSRALAPRAGRGGFEGQPACDRSVGRSRSVGKKLAGDVALSLAALQRVVVETLGELVTAEKEEAAEAHPGGARQGAGEEGGGPA